MGAAGRHSNTDLENDVYNTPAQTLYMSNAELVITLVDIMKAITTCNCSVNTLSRSLEGMREDMIIIRRDIHAFKVRMSVAEERISTLEDSLHPVLKANKKVTQQLTMHDSHLEGMENCLCRNNVRIV